MLDTSQEFRNQLLSCGILSAAEVENVEQQAEAEALDLASVLQKKHILTDKQIHALHAMRVSVPYCNLSDFIPNVQNAKLMPEDIARRHVMFPLFNLDNVITLVMEDPSDLTGIDQVRRLTRQEVDVCLSSRSDIFGLIERAYGSSKYLEESSLADSLSDVSSDVEGDESQPVIRLVNDLILEAIRQGASDIHIEPGDRELRVRIRVDGVLREIAAPPLGVHRAIVSRIKILSRLDISKTRSPQDGAFDLSVDGKEIVLRVSVLPSIFGEAVVLRILRNESEAITLVELGMGGEMLNSFEAIISNAHGMILVSGPTGSGKSTTLYAAMKCIASPQKNIIAIEDPVEYRTSIIRQVQVNSKANLTFSSGLRSILRQDPDVFMVGEVRDTETAQISIQAALTGHMVLSTVHTNDAISAVARLRDLGIAEFLISSALLGVLAQRLCRKICPECKEPDSPSDFLLSAIGLDPKHLEFEPMRGKGCRRCMGSGYLSRIGLYELFVVNDEFRNMIVSGSSTETIVEKARNGGMSFLVDDGVDKIRQGITTVDEIVRMAGRS